MRTTRATAPGSPLPQHGPGGAGTSSVDVALAGAQLELGGHRAAQLAELDGLVAQRHVGVEPAEVEQLAGQPPEAPQLALGALHLAPGVLLVETAVAQVLLEQLDRALQRGQRRAQLVRGRRDERAPRRLLAAQLALHRGQRAGEVADLVEAVVARGRGVGPLLGDAHRGGAQAREAPADRRWRAGCRAARRRRGPTAAAATKALRTWCTAVVDVGELLLRDEDEVGAEVALRSHRLSRRGR